MSNIFKKIIALVTVAIIVIRIFTINAFALFTAPAAGATLAEILAALLASTCGYSQTQLDSMSVTEMQNALSENISNGNVDVKSVYDIVFPVDSAFSSTERSLIEFFGDPLYAASQDAFWAVIKSWFKSQFSSYEVLKDSLAETSSFDMKGYGAAMYIEPLVDSPPASWAQIVYCDYIVITQAYIDGTSSYFNLINCRGQYTFSGVWSELSQEVSVGSKANYLNWGVVHLYGDVRLDDGTEYPFEDLTSVPDEDTVIGTLPDGTEVTIGDLIGTDGLIDGVFPDIDWDLFDPAALIDLIKDLLDRYAEEASKTDSSELEDSIADSVDDILGDTALELEGLENLLLPTSIVHVFPFCLPWDFVQGMYLFEAEPEVPYFETELDFTNLMGYDLGKYKIVIDLEAFDTLATISRWLSMFSFVYTLIFLSVKIVKGGGA